MENTRLEIKVYRDIFGRDFTAGKLYLCEKGHKKFFCHTLEDTARPTGIKIPKETCVPEGVAMVRVTRSQRFKRDMIILFNRVDLSLVLGGVSFTGIRAHGGNRIDDTEGCPLVAYNRISDNVIQGSAEKELTRIVKKALASGRTVVWEWINGER